MLTKKFLNAFKLYFGFKAGDQDKIWVHFVYCLNHHKSVKEDTKGIFEKQESNSIHSTHLFCTYFILDILVHLVAIVPIDDNGTLYST